MQRRRRNAVNDFGAIADVYDELVDWAPYERWTDDLEVRLRRWGLAPGGWVLDAACGTGLSTLPWIARGYNVVGTDASEIMLDRARQRLRSAGAGAGQVELKRQDLLSLAPGRLFDAAVCMHSGLDYILDMADLARAFESLRACLKPGGLFAFDKCLDVPGFYQEDRSDSRPLSCGSVDFAYRWDRTRKLLEQRCVVHRTDGPRPRRTEVVFHLQAVEPAELVAMVEQAGFTTLEEPREFTVLDPGAGVFRAV